MHKHKKLSCNVLADEKIKDERLPDSNEKQGEDFVRWLCAGLAMNSRNKICYMYYS